MKIELKNIQHSPSLSEETEAFTANLYIDGVHVGFAKNQGHGGPTDYHAIKPEFDSVIAQAEAYCKGLPPDVYPSVIDDGGPMVIEMNLENFIDKLLSEHLKQKDVARLRRLQAKQILFGNIDSGTIAGIAYRRPLAEILTNPKGAEILADNIRKDILPELKEGMKIINDNLPESIYIKAGLKRDQYTLPEVIKKAAKEKVPKKKPGPKKGTRRG